MPRTFGTSNASPYASAPVVGVAGDTYWDSTTETLYVSDGTAWNICVGPGTITGNELATFAVTTTKLNTNAVIMNKIVAAANSPATIGRIAAGTGNYSEIAGAPVIVCTSSTRPTGVSGLCIFETDTYKFLVYTTATTGWQPPWNAAWGRLGYFQRTTDTGAFSGTDVQYGQSVNASVPANRLLRIDAGWRSANSTSANGVGFIRIRTGSTTLQEWQLFANASNVGIGGYMSCFHTPSAGTATYFMTGTSSVSTFAIQASTTYPHWISITDVGPSANPA